MSQLEHKSTIKITKPFVIQLINDYLAKDGYILKDIFPKFNTPSSSGNFDWMDTVLEAITLEEFKERQQKLARQQS